jgi:hypothetical protein
MFKLNNNLIVKGFPELERINAEARNLLVNYYTDCEKKYIQGMKFVLQDKKSKNDAATAVQATAQAQAQATAQAQAAQLKAPQLKAPQAIPIKPQNQIIQPQTALEQAAAQAQAKLAAAKKAQAELLAARTEENTGAGATQIKLKTRR